MTAGPMNIQLACCGLGESLFAVDIMRIREIILPPPVASLPAPTRFLDGVINLRGAVIPVMNLRRRFGMPPAREGASGRLLIVTLPRQLLALAVDDVLEVITVPAGEIMPPPEMEETMGAECILGVCLAGERVFMILDIDALTGAAEWLETIGESGADR